MMLGIFVLAALVLTTISILVWCEGVDSCWRLGLGCVCLNTWAFLILSSTQPYVVDRVEYLQVSTVSNVQVAVVDSKAINLNEKLSRVIGEKEKVKCVHYKTGPYLGLYYDPHYKLIVEN